VTNFDSAQLHFQRHVTWILSKFLFTIFLRFEVHVTVFDNVSVVNLFKYV